MKKLCVVCAMMLLVVGCGKKTEKQEIRGEIPAFHTPANASNRIEGQRYPYCLWYNPNQWMIWHTPFDTGGEAAEWNLVLIPLDERKSIGKETKIRARVSTYPYADRNLSQQEFKMVIQSKIINKNSLESFVDLGSGERIVNHLKIFFWDFLFKPTGATAMRASIYFYSDNEGSVAIAAYSQADQWEENKGAITDLLNGFCLLKS